MHNNNHKLAKVLAYVLVICLSFVIAQAYELMCLYDKHITLEKKYAELWTKKSQPVYLPVVPPKNFNIQTSLSAPDNPEEHTLAQRNKNPLNIKKLSGNKTWEGQIGVDEQGHAIFSSWEYGIRAASFTLKNYALKHKIDTVEDTLRRFCEAQGKQFENYVNFVCRELGVKKNQKINLIAYMPKLLRAMARFESGMNLPEELFVSYDVLAYL